MEKQYDVGDLWTIGHAEKLYKEKNVASVVTDGRYVRLEKEPISRQAK